MVRLSRRDDGINLGLCSRRRTTLTSTKHCVNWFSCCWTLQTHARIRHIIFALLLILRTCCHEELSESRYSATMLWPCACNTLEISGTVIRMSRRLVKSQASCHPLHLVAAWITILRAFYPFDKRQVGPRSLSLRARSGSIPTARIIIPLERI